MNYPHFSDKDKQTLVRAIAYYYENHVWGDLVRKDESAASEEDYALRHVCEHLSIRNLLPMEITSRF